MRTGEFTRLLRRVPSRLVFPPGREGQVADHWTRLVMNDRIDEVLRPIEATSDALEVSGTDHRSRRWRHYESIAWPEYDICDPSIHLDRHFDVVIAEQVLEHVADPWQATRNMAAMVNEGGMVVVTTPFLIKVHGSPKDYWRFTADGLRLLLEQAGLVVEEVGSWGNRQCVVGNFARWSRRTWWQSLKNEEDFPVSVWAIGRKPSEGSGRDSDT